MERTMQSHLGTIEGTFQQCDAILGNMQALMSSSPAAPPQAATAAVPLVFTQDLLAVRRSIEEGNKKLIDTKERLEKLEDMQIHDTIAATTEQAWAREQISSFWTSLTKLDETLRSDVDKNFCGVRTEFNDVRAELQLCQSALQAAATPARRVATAAGATEQKPAPPLLDERGMFRGPRAPGRYAAGRPSRIGITAKLLKKPGGLRIVLSDDPAEMGQATTRTAAETTTM